MSKRFTRRQREVLYWIRVTGATITNREIAVKMGVRRRTVKFMVSTMLEKLSAHTKKELL